jgi:hypothetical protein
MYPFFAEANLTVDRLAAKLSAYVRVLYRLGGYATVVVLFEIDSRVTLAKQATCLQRRASSSSRKGTMLTKEEDAYMRSSGALPTYDTVRKTRGARDWIFGRVSALLRARCHAWLPAGKTFIIGATAAHERTAYAFTEGRACAHAAEIRVPIAGEVDIGAGWWCKYFIDRPRVVVANDCDLIGILTLNAPRGISAAQHDGEFAAPLFLFRHGLLYSTYLRIAHGETRATVPQAKTLKSYATPYLDVHSFWHSLVDDSVAASRPDPMPPASFFLLMVLLGCDYITHEVFVGLGSKPLYKYWLEYRGDAFVDVQYGAQEEAVTIVASFEAFARFHAFVRVKKPKVLRRSQHVLRANFYRALWVLVYWLNGTLGAEHVPDPLARSEPCAATPTMACTGSPILLSAPARCAESLYGWQQTSDGLVQQSATVFEEPSARRCEAHIELVNG